MATSTPTPLSHLSASTITPSSVDSSNNTFLMAASPIRRLRSNPNAYRPQIITTVGARPACLVNASVTYVGDDQIYAFGGFDQYTDEVYNHVLRLNLQTKQWNLVDNYGDIPGVRMGMCHIFLSCLPDTNSLQDTRQTCGKAISSWYMAARMNTGPTSQTS